MDSENINGGNFTQLPLQRFILLLLFSFLKGIITKSEKRIATKVDPQMFCKLISLYTEPLWTQMLQNHIYDMNSTILRFKTVQRTNRISISLCKCNEEL